MKLKKLGVNYVTEVSSENVANGPDEKYAFIYLGSLYLPKDCCNKNVKITIKVEVVS